MRIRKYEKEVSTKDNNINLAFKFIFAAVMAAMIGFIGFILGFISGSSLIIASSSLAVSVCMFMCSLANYYLGKKKKDEKEYLKYSFINNSILLSTKTINRNGFYEIWRQENEEHSIQILCYNQETEEFQAFDRFHWMNESGQCHVEIDGKKFNCITYDISEKYFNEDLWTPIKLHYTIEWLKKHII